MFVSARRPPFFRFSTCPTSGAGADQRLIDPGAGLGRVVDPDDEAGVSLVGESDDDRLVRVTDVPGDGVAVGAKVVGQRAERC